MLERKEKENTTSVSSFNMGTLIRDLKSNYKENDYQILTLSTDRHIIYTTTITLKCLVGEKPYWKSLSPHLRQKLSNYVIRITKTSLFYMSLCHICNQWEISWKAQNIGNEI